MKVHGALSFSHELSIYWILPINGNKREVNKRNKAIFIFLGSSSLLIYPNERQEVILIEQVSMRHVLNVNDVHMPRHSDGSIVHNHTSLFPKVRGGVKKINFFVIVKQMWGAHKYHVGIWNF